MAENLEVKVTTETINRDGDDDDDSESDNEYDDKLAEKEEETSEQIRNRLIEKRKQRLESKRQLLKLSWFI